MPKGPILNLLRFNSILNILGSLASNETVTDVGSLKGFLKINILDVLLPTAVEIGYGSIIVGTRPLPSTLYSHFPTTGCENTILPLST